MSVLFILQVAVVMSFLKDRSHRVVAFSFGRKEGPSEVAVHILIAARCIGAGGQSGEYHAQQRLDCSIVVAAIKVHGSTRPTAPRRRVGVTSDLLEEDHYYWHPTKRTPYGTNAAELILLFDVVRVVTERGEEQHVWVENG